MSFSSRAPPPWCQRRIDLKSPLQMGCVHQAENGWVPGLPSTDARALLVLKVSFVVAGQYFRGKIMGTIFVLPCQTDAQGSKNLETVMPPKPFGHKAAWHSESIGFRLLSRKSMWNLKTDLFRATSFLGALSGFQSESRIRDVSIFVHKDTWQ